MSPLGMDEVAGHLHMTPRTLRRRLHAEETSFRKVLTELRMRMASKYLRDTDSASAKSRTPLAFVRTRVSAMPFAAGRTSRCADSERTATSNRRFVPISSILSQLIRSALPRIDIVYGDTTGVPGIRSRGASVYLVIADSPRQVERSSRNAR